MSSKRGQSEGVQPYRPDVRPSFCAACFGISLGIHLALLGLLLFSPFGASDARLNPPEAISVELVSFNPEVPSPPAAPRGQTEAVPVQDSSVAAKKSNPPEKTEEAVAIPVKKGIEKKVAKNYDLKMPEPEVKTSLKKDTFDPQQVIDQAIERLSRESEKRRPESVKQRIARLEKQVGDLAYKGRLSSRVTDKGAAAAEDFGPLEIYQAEVAVRMKRNWAFSRELAGSTEGLETRLVIKIMPDGTITDVWFEKRSGNAYLDESAYKTVMKANPLPPLPEGYPYYHLVLGFTPAGLSG